MYSVVPREWVISPRGWNYSLEDYYDMGVPPYLITSIQGADKGGYAFEYINPSSPCPVRGYAADWLLFNIYEKQSNKDLVFHFPGQVVNPKDWTTLMVYYDRRIKDQVEALLSALDWDSVKIEQQSQFVQGVRISKIAPLLGLKMCMDAYNFDDFWANINWADPRTYLGAVKEVIGLAKALR